MKPFFPGPLITNNNNSNFNNNGLGGLKANNGDSRLLNRLSNRSPLDRLGSPVSAITVDF
eukprot:Awhi_evm1s8841